jgi:hypothetical protein
MTNVELNETLAEFHGFTKSEPWLNGTPCWEHKDHPHTGFSEIPDFVGDLNVIHDAWRRLSPLQKKAYKIQLAEVVFREILGSKYLSLDELEDDVYGMAQNASSRQRAQALYELLSK